MLLLLFRLGGFLFSVFSCHMMTNGTAANSTYNGVFVGNVASYGANGSTFQTAFSMGQ
jgi:hypothetical protein